MTTLMKSLNNKYSDDEEELSFGFVLFVSSSPEAKRGLLPNIITLNDYFIESFGELSDLSLGHISELDLTDNLLSDWSEVFKIITEFPSLTFLNLSSNLLKTPIQQNTKHTFKTKMKKLVLNGNKLAWQSVAFLLEHMEALEELHLSTNFLHDLGDVTLEHGSLRLLYLSCNPLADFNLIYENLLAQCPRLEFLSMAECPVNSIPNIQNHKLKSLNVSNTGLKSWQEVEKLRNYGSLTELRIQGCPFLDGYTAHERRMMLVARLPNIQVLNGGDKISALEREDSEREFIRYYLDTPPEQRPHRYEQLTEIHGVLEPLANVDLTPEVNINVRIQHEDITLEVNISVRQTVKTFKLFLQGLFNILPANMKLWYYDQELSQVTGPEEMKWGNKALYTYNVREGDYFVVDQKTILKPLKTSRGTNAHFFGSLSPQNRSAPVRPSNQRTGPSTTSTPTRHKLNRTSSMDKKSGVSPGTRGAKTAFTRTGDSLKKNYGEFHHSKVFRDTPTTPTAITNADSSSS